jgi:hypothetical protein
LARVLAFGGPAVGSGGMEAREERPRLFRPAGVGEGVVAAFLPMQVAANTTASFVICNLGGLD